MFTFGPGLRGGIVTRGSGTLPTARGSGAFVATSLANNLNVSWPTASAANDLGLLFGFTSIGRAIATPSGWGLLRNFSVSNGAGGGIQAYVFWKYNSGSDTSQNISIGGSAGFILASLYGVRNAFYDASSGPFDAIDVSTGVSSVSTATFPNIITAESNSLVFLAAIRAESGFPWFTMSTVGNLAAFNEVADSGFSAGATKGSLAYGVTSRSGAGDIGSVTAAVTAGIVSTLAFNVFG